MEQTGPTFFHNLERTALPFKFMAFLVFVAIPQPSDQVQDQKEDNKETVYSDSAISSLHKTIISSATAIGIKFYIVFRDQCSAVDEHDKTDKKLLLEILNNIFGGLSTSMNLTSN
jgi:hypothetical protein